MHWIFSSWKVLEYGGKKSFWITAGLKHFQHQSSKAEDYVPLYAKLFTLKKVFRLWKKKGRRRMVRWLLSIEKKKTAKLAYLRYAKLSIIAFKAIFPFPYSSSQEVSQAFYVKYAFSLASLPLLNCRYYTFKVKFVKACKISSVGIKPRITYSTTTKLSWAEN